MSSACGTSLARRASSGSPADHAALAACVRALGEERSTAVLRAFGLYFQLANVAEAWHRVRSRRRYEREEQIPRESLAEAFGRLAASGVEPEEQARRAREVSLELVITAHPTEAARRTVLQAQLQLSRILEALDDPALGPVGAAAARGRGRGRDHGALAGRRGALATPARRRRDPPRALVLRDDAARRRARRAGRLPRAASGSPVPLRFGSWVGGDQDGNPEAGPDTVAEWLERARRLALTRYRVEVRELARAIGVSTRMVPVERRAHGLDRARRGRARRVRGRDRRSELRRAVPAQAELRRPAASRTCSTATREPGYADAGELLADLELMDASLRANRGARIADGPLAELRRRVELFGFHIAKLDVRLHANQLVDPRRAHARDVPRRPRRAASATARARSTRSSSRAPRGRTTCCARST